MSAQANLIFKPSIKYETELFLCLLRSWAKESPTGNPENILSQVQVTCVTQMKMASPPEHEFLVIETVETVGAAASGKKRTFILERAQGKNETDDAETDDAAAPGDDKPRGKYEMIKEASYSAFVDECPNELVSMEEGNFSSISMPQPTTCDKMTVLSMKLLDVSSENNDKLQNHLAEDVFLGEDFVFAKSRHAENLRHFQPGKELTLFDLAILAHAVHKRYPKYTLLKEQCYFFSGIIYFAILSHCGLRLGSSSNHDGVVNSDKSGRWNNIKVCGIDVKMVLEVVSDFKEARAKEFVGLR